MFSPDLSTPDYLVLLKKKELGFSLLKNPNSLTIPADQKASTETSVFMYAFMHVLGAFTKQRKGT